MEKRKVRIYKAHDGEGKYINKTKKFLDKAQDGMEVSGGQDDVKQQLDNVRTYIMGLKENEVEDEDILKVLVNKGLRKEIVSYLINEINSEIEEEAEAAQKQEEGTQEEDAEGQEEMPQEEEVVAEEPDQAMDYYNSYANEEEEDFNPNMEYQYGGKTSKKHFTKNVLHLLKKQEGGAEKELGKGERFDTISSDASKKKSDFVSKLKEIADKAAVDELYKKMMSSNNPELIQGAQKIAEERNKPAEGTFEEAQSGGFIGDKQPDMFMYGGTDMPFYEADFLPEAKRGIISGKAYNTRTKEEYKDSFEGLNPYAKTVHKRGLFGRPKQWTEYYSKSTGKPIVPTDKDKNLKHGVEKELWDDLSGKAKREIRRGDRQLGREARRGAKSLAEDAKFNKGVHARYKYDTEEDLARDQKRSDDAWDKDESFVSDIDNSIKSPYKGFVYNTHDPRGNRYEEPRLAAMPELLPYGLKEADFTMPSMPERPLQEDETSDRNLLDAETIREADEWEIQHKKDVEKADKEQAEKEEREHPLSIGSFESSLINLQDSKDSEFEYADQKLKNLVALKQRNREYTVKENKDLDPLNDKDLYRFIPGKSKEELEFRDGGLPKAQTGPPEKKESDATTTTNQLPSIMSKNNGLDGNRSVNPNNLKGMPDQLNKQFLGEPKKEEGLGDDDVIAIDKQRAPSNFTGADGVNAFNVGATAVTGFMNNLDTAKQQKEMYDNNFTSDNMYAASNSKDRGDYVDYGQQVGQFRYDQMGSDTSGRFAYGQTGGYMEEGGYVEGGVVDMTEEELEEFLANGGEVEYLES